jgi:O-antigen ligase
VKTKEQRKVLKRSIEESPQIHPLTGMPVARPLVPDWLFAGLLLCSLAVPNLVFSGPNWFDTLHLLKFFWALVPVALLTALAGVRLARWGAEATGFTIDPFGWLWLLLILYVTVQPLWVPLTSVPTFVKEWFFLAALWIVYVLCYNLVPPGEALRVFLWGAMIDASINILFAEIQVRSLQGPFPFILGTPGFYIGNTGQQEMFAFWLALTTLAGIFLHVYYSLDLSEETRRTPRVRILRGLNLLFLAWVSWGLWNSTGRSGILGLFVSLTVLGICLGRIRGRASLKPLAQGVALVLLVLALNGLMGNLIPGGSRVGALQEKMTDMVVNVERVGLRDNIWRVSWNMFLHRPLGVGLGHFKWTYVEAMRWTWEKHPDVENSYTLWAHNEYLQWFCEAGWPGGLLLLGLGVWWLARFVGVLRRRDPIPVEAMWGIAALFLIWFVALWSRPFHRIENALWMSLAFALANRAILPSSASWCEVRRPGLTRALGALAAACALGGLLFLFDGMWGDRLLFAAATGEGGAEGQMEYLNRARRHLMKRNDAEKQTAYFLISYGQAAKRRDLLQEGAELLESASRKQLEMKDVMDLMSVWGMLNRRDKVDEYVRYLKPGTYQIHDPADSRETPASSASPASGARSGS